MHRHHKPIPTPPSATHQKGRVKMTVASSKGVDGGSGGEGGEGGEGGGGCGCGEVDGGDGGLRGVGSGGVAGGTRLSHRQLTK